MGELAQQDGKVEEGIEQCKRRSEHHRALKWTQLDQTGESKHEESKIQPTKPMGELEGLQSNEDCRGPQKEVLQSGDGEIHAFFLYRCSHRSS